VACIEPGVELRRTLPPRALPPSFGRKPHIQFARERSSVSRQLASVAEVNFIIESNCEARLAITVGAICAATANTEARTSQQFRERGRFTSCVLIFCYASHHHFTSVTFQRVSFPQAFRRFSAASRTMTSRALASFFEPGR
jgi:hypothetical protein